MKSLYVCAALLSLSACAETVSRQDQALRDFIEIEELEEQREIRTSSRDSREIINADFIIYKAQKQDYLVEFRSSCRDLVEHKVVADKRWDSYTLRSRFDTINGCLIRQIYALAEGQGDELIQLGQNTEP